MPSSKFAFTLLELNNTFASSTPFSLASAFSIRLIQDGQLSVSNCNSIFFILISPLICSTFSIEGLPIDYLDVRQNLIVNFKVVRSEERRVGKECRIELSAGMSK